MITIIVVNIYNVKNEILFQITKSSSKYSDLVGVLKAINLLMLFSFECVVFCVYWLLLNFLYKSRENVIFSFLKGFVDHIPYFFWRKRVFKIVFLILDHVLKNQFFLYRFFWAPIDFIGNFA